MRICIIAEGSYPYITGGVSSWIQMLITGMPEHEFIIYSIGAEEKNKGKFKYSLPDNIVEVKEVFLDSILNQQCSGTTVFPLTSRQKDMLFSLICGEGEIKIDELVGIFRSSKKRAALSIFMSFNFFDIITAVYKERYSHLPFTDFFWTVRSMLLPLFFLLQQGFPRADVYHSVATGYAGVVGSLAAKMSKRPFILTEHGIYSREREEEIIQSNWVESHFKDLWINYFYSLARLTYFEATRVFSLFAKNAEIEVALGCDAGKIEIITNGVDVELYEGVSAKPAEEDTVVIGAVVRVVPIKDIITMLRSFSLVIQALPSARFLILGPTDENEEYYEECLNMVERLNLKSCVQFTGTVNVNEYLGKLDIMVLSSVSEGQPLAVLEGMACHKPFVTTDVGSCRELLYGNNDSLGPAGIIVPLMDFEAMAQAIIGLARDKELRRSMGENAYQRIAQYYTKAGMITSYRQVYAELGGVMWRESVLS